ncbi:MAG: hypothetical protein ACOX18_07955 [Bacillota bacterium]|jgi:hypothetical protein
MSRPVFIERTRELAYAGQVNVAVGDWVQETDVVAHLDYLPGRLQRFPAARQLAVPEAELRSALIVQEGDWVESGDPVGMAYRFGEWRIAHSPYQGYIGLVSRLMGHVYIREPIPLGSHEPVNIDVAQELGVNPMFYKDYLLVREGSNVIPDQPLAVRRGSPQHKYVLSPIYGRVHRVQDGKIELLPLHARTELQAYLAGRVTAVRPGHGVTIRAWAHLVQGVYGIGGEAGGELLLAAGPHQVLSSSDVGEHWRGKVVVAGQTADVQLLAAAREAGAVGLILGYLPYEELHAFTGGSGLLGLTGDEAAGLTLILTEGFLAAPLNEAAWSTLQGLEGRYASINGTTHIRAGVIRPEIVVSEPEWPAAAAAGNSPGEERELQPGSLVRLLRDPLRGQVGEVCELYTRRQPMESGSLVRAARVRVAGQDVTVPIANLALLKGKGDDADGGQ